MYFGNMNSQTRFKQKKPNQPMDIVFFGDMDYDGNMRSDTARSVLNQDRRSGDEMLTTGEAARLLNSSRQHIVDLCNTGDLPYQTVGTHRRVRRTDVEAIRDRTLRMTRDQRRSRWLAFAIAGRIAEDPDGARSLAYENLERMREQSRGQSVVWFDEWERLLAGPTAHLLDDLTSYSPRSRDLRPRDEERG